MITTLQLGINGRLANQMWQIAVTIGIAKRFNHQFAFPYWQNHDHHLSQGAAPTAKNDDIDVQKYFRNKLPVIPSEINIEHEVILPFHFVNPVVRDNTNIKDCCPQSEKYFKFCENDIHHYFEFDIGHLIEKVGIEKISDALKSMTLPVRTCGIHIRRGDYLKKPGYHTNLDIRYYLAAISQFPDNTHFIVFSDDIAGAKEMLGTVTDRHITYQEENSYMLDFWLMTQCDNFIIANSSYSWWGAWLIKSKKKKVVAPKNWLGPEAGDIITSDIYPEDWIVI